MRRVELCRRVPLETPLRGFPSALAGPRALSGSVFLGLTGATEIGTRLIPGPLDEEGTGASTYVMKCSVTMDTEDLSTQREIASAIQGSGTSSLKDLWIIAFPHKVKTKLTCGVESSNDKMAICWLCMKTEYIYYFLYVCTQPAELCFKELARNPGNRELLGWHQLESLQRTISTAHHVH